VVVTEGEKAADALLRLGIAAAGIVTGAKATPSDDSLRPLLGRSVVLWPDADDADDAGERHMTRIATRLVALVVTPRIIWWADAPRPRAMPLTSCPRAATPTACGRCWTPQRNGRRCLLAMALTLTMRDPTRPCGRRTTRIWALPAAWWPCTAKIC
jgi:hypothetical protein